MKKKLVSLIAVVLMLSFLVMPTVFAPQQAKAATGAWYLVKSELYRPSSDLTVNGGPTESHTMSGQLLLDYLTIEGQEGDMVVTVWRTGGDGTLFARSSQEVIWDKPPSTLIPGQKVGMNLEVRTLIAEVWSPTGANIKFDNAGMSPGFVTAGVIYFVTTDGAKQIPPDHKAYLETENVIPAGNVGDKKAIYVTLSEGYGYIYTYEWKAQAPPATTTPTAPTTTNSAQAFDSGCRISWQPVSNALGYRLFRSTSKSSLGESVTDFYITSTSYADVNVEPNTTYYYTVKPVLKEANPYQDIDEQLGSAIATFTVTTGNKIDTSGNFKHFIMLKLNSPYMTVDGVSREVDPGKGTAPLIISGRTMVPIRAVVEAMGGTAKWDATAKKVTLNARGNTVEMWVGNKTIKVNGVSKKVDVPCVIKNGRTFVPLRFAAENLKSKVDWINSTQEAVIVYKEE